MYYVLHCNELLAILLSALALLFFRPSFFLDACIDRNLGDMNGASVL